MWPQGGGHSSAPGSRTWQRGPQLQRPGPRAPTLDEPVDISPARKVQERCSGGGCTVDQGLERQRTGAARDRLAFPGEVGSTPAGQGLEIVRGGRSHHRHAEAASQGFLFLISFLVLRVVLPAPSEQADGKEALLEMTLCQSCGRT